MQVETLLGRSAACVSALIASFLVGVGGAIAQQEPPPAPPPILDVGEAVVSGFSGVVAPDHHPLYGFNRRQIRRKGRIHGPGRHDSHSARSQGVPGEWRHVATLFELYRRSGLDLPGFGFADQTELANTHEGLPDSTAMCGRFRYRSS